MTHHLGLTAAAPDPVTGAGQKPVLKTLEFPKQQSRYSCGTNVNNILVKDGWCWWYRKYALGDTVLEGLVTAKSISEGSVTDRARGSASRHSLYAKRRISASLSKSAALQQKVLGEYIQEMCEAHVEELERKGILPKGK